MNTHDKDGVEYAKLSELKIGDKVRPDAGFDCLSSELEYKVKEGKRTGSKIIYCSEGYHDLEAQLDDESNSDHLIGIYKGK